MSNILSFSYDNTQANIFNDSGKTSSFVVATSEDIGSNAFEFVAKLKQDDDDGRQRFDIFRVNLRFQKFKHFYWVIDITWQLMTNKKALILT